MVRLPLPGHFSRSRAEKQTNAGTGKEEQGILSLGLERSFIIIDAWLFTPTAFLPAPTVHNFSYQI